MGKRRHERQELTREQREERFSTAGVGFEESLQRVRAGPDEEEEDVAGVEPRDTSRPLSEEELRQMEERAKERFADPEYRRRVSKTDRFVESQLRKPQQ